MSFCCVRVRARLCAGTFLDLSALPNVNPVTLYLWKTKKAAACLM